MQRKSRWAAALVAVACAGAAMAVACEDDDDVGQEEAGNITGTFEDLRSDLEATGNIEDADGDVKDSLKDNCGELQDEIDSNQLDAFCQDLSAAIDDENQGDYELVKARFATEVDAPFRQFIADAAADAGDDGDDPLEGGDEGDTDENDDDDIVDDDGLDNPLDDEDGDGN